MLANIGHWITAHWLIISGVLGALITILNAATSVWHDHPKTIRWLSVIISTLSVVRSKGADPGVLGALKLPFVPEFKSKSMSSAVKVITSALLACALMGCTTTSSGTHGFDPGAALTTACAVEPSINILATAGVCDNLKEPAKSTCLKVSAIIHAAAPLLLSGAGAIYDACRGIAPRSLIKTLERPTSLPVK